MKLDKPLRIVIPALIVLAIALALFVPWRCSAQIAGTIDFSRDYSAKLNEIMTEQHGPDWKRMVRDNWAEAWKNLTSGAREQYRERRASLFDDEGLERYLTQQEARQVGRALDSAKARKTAEEIERQRADSIAAAQQTQGAVISREDAPQLAGLGIGKSLSPRMAMLGGLISERPAPTLPAEPQHAPPSGALGGDGFVTYVYVVHALAIVGLFSLGYWVYTAATR